MATGVIAAAVVVLIAVPAVALTTGGGGQNKVTAIGAPTTQSSEDTTTVPVVGVVNPEAPPLSSTTTATPQRLPTTTTTEPVCRNSTDPRCGPFRWDPEPAPNQPLTVHLTYSPAHPRPGEVVHFYPVGDDPDAAFITSASCPDFGDRPGPPCPVDSGVGTRPGQQPPPPPRAYGAWTPPAPEHGHCPGPMPDCQFFFSSYSSRDASGACSVDYAYKDPGTYTVKLSYDSFARPAMYAKPGYPGLRWGVDGLNDPYANRVTASVTVKVSGPPVTTTTTPGPHVYVDDC